MPGSKLGKLETASSMTTDACSLATVMRMSRTQGVQSVRVGDSAMMLALISKEAGGGSTRKL